jgi:hypothetical protein
MDRKNLKLRNCSWHARLKVPLSLQAIVGKSELVRASHTRDLREANRLKHAVLAQMHDQLIQAEARATMPVDAASMLLATARAMTEAVTAGRATQREADTAMQIRLREQRGELESQAQAAGVSPAQIVERTLVLARRALHGGRVYAISKTIRTYLDEKAPYVTRQTFEQKQRQLGELADWVGTGSEVTNLTKEQAGRYIHEKLLTKGNAIKTVKDTLSHLRAFWAWLAGRGIVEVNIWNGASQTLRASTRGKEEKRRPWTDAEVKKLLLGIPTTDPLWPLSAIGAYTGMRREEIAQRAVADVFGRGLIVREGKTAAAVRRIPIHPMLQPLIDRLMRTSTDGYLIPGLLTGGADGRRGHYLGKRFTNVRRTLGLDSPQTVFHSFRKALAQRCEDQEVPESTTELIGGWSRGRRMSYGLYSPGPGFETLRKAISRVSYGEVDELVRTLGPEVTITKWSKRRTFSRPRSRVHRQEEGS